MGCISFKVAHLPNMSPANARLLFTYYKEKKDYSSVRLSRYNKEGLHHLLEQIEDHSFPEFNNRYLLVNETIQCYENGYYGAAISIIIPQIEGILWDYAKIYNRKYKNIYKVVGSDYYLLTNKGQELKKYTVGNLLQQSEFGELFNQDLLHYFCDELYNERNPIFHGRDLEFPTKLNAAKKLCSFEYIMEQINDNLIEELLKTMKEMFKKEDIDKVINEELTLESFIEKD